MSSADLGRQPHRGGPLAIPGVRSAPLRGRDLAGGARSIGVVAGVAAAAVIAGWLIANGDAKYVVAALIPLPVLLIALNRRVSGPLAGVLLLLILNGVPGVSLGGRLPSGIRVQDVAVMVLAVLLFAYRDRSERSATGPYRRAARIWGACLVAWWALTLARSVLLEGIPLKLAVLYGRDFLYFAILLPLALSARLPARSLRIAGMIVLAATVAYGAGQAIAGVTGVTLSWLVHPAIIGEAFGQSTRFYSPMNYAVETCLFFAGALWLSKDSPVNRRILGAVVVVLAASAILGLTRANYFGIAVAVVVASLVYMRRHGSATAVLVRAVIVILVLLAAVTLFTVITGRASSLTNNPVASRVTRGLSDVSQSTGTFGFRKRTDSLMLQLLHSDWPIGLGFLHPAVHYVPGLPSGSIRSSDTGVFNALVTMGVVGLLLMYAPVLYAGRELLRVSRRTWASAQALPRWILYGGIAWIAWAISSSLTLDLFFSTPGVAVAAVGLASLGRMIKMTTEEVPAAAAAGAPGTLMAGPAGAGAFTTGPPGTRRLSPGRGAVGRVPGPNGLPAGLIPGPNGLPAARVSGLNGLSGGRELGVGPGYAGRTLRPNGVPGRALRPNGVPDGRALRPNGVPQERTRRPNGRPLERTARPAGAPPQRAPTLPPGPPPQRTPTPTGAPAPAPAPVVVEAPAAQTSVAHLQISAVIVTYNSSHCISDCIKALRTTLGHCEIIVVDNLSDDDTISAVWSTDERVRVISKGRNAGYGSACNSGVRAASNDHVLLMNPDVVLEHTDLDGLHAIVSADPLGVVAPAIQGRGQRTARPQTFAPSSWLEELGVMALGPFRPRALPQRSRLAETDDAAWASGALMLVRRSEFLALGGFDERFFLYYEDQELGHRYRQAGLPIRSTDAITAGHHGGLSVAASNDQRVAPMAWCIAGWLELVAMEHGVRRARLSWSAIRAAHYAGRRLAEWGGDVSRLSRLRRKAEQLNAVDAALTRIATEGINSEHPACPTACRIIYETSKQ